MTKVREIMEYDAYVCSENSTVFEVMEYLNSKEVSGVPIVDGNSKVIGFISDGDIMKCVAHQNLMMVGEFDSPLTLIDDIPLEEKVSELMETKAMEFATKRVVCIDVDENVDDAARILSKKKIKKVPVLENGVMVGIVSRSTIIRHIMQNMLAGYENKK